MLTPCHYVIDLQDVGIPLDKPEFISTYMTKVCDDLDLKYLGKPNIQLLKDPENGDGITATLILTTSLLSLHTYSKEKCVYIDLFACKLYDANHFYDFSFRYFLTGRASMERIYRVPHRAS